MNKLMVGSYGTLGLLTEVTLKIWPLPAARSSLLIYTADLAQALHLAGRALSSAVICSGLTITRGPDGPDPGLHGRGSPD